MTARTSDPSGEWLSPAEAAKLLGVGPKTIYRAIRFGGLKHARLPGRGKKGRILRIKRSWLDEWVERCATTNEFPWFKKGGGK